MLVLRSKKFSFFGLFKKKQPEKKEEITYTCPTIKDLPTNLQQSLRGVERVWKKPEVQKMLKYFGEKYIIVGDGNIPYKPYIDQREVEHVHKNILVPTISFYDYPQDSLIYPLMWNCGLNDGELLCYDIKKGKFLSIFGGEWDLEEIDHVRVLKDWIKSDLDLASDCIDEDYGFSEDEIKEFNDLIRKIKKQFWL